MAKQAGAGLWIALGVALALWALSRTQGGSQMLQKGVTAVGDALAPRGLRNNNPGNIVRTADVWRGMSADQSNDSRFVVFDAPVWGLRAMARLLRKYLESGATTVREIIARWAPSTENDTSAYIDAVAGALGLGPDDAVTLAQLPDLMAAIVRHENGVQPYAVAMFDDAIYLERNA